jgi:hypothetical protein
MDLQISDQPDMRWLDGAQLLVNLTRG